MKKIFRIVRNNLSDEAEKSYYPLRYRIEVRHTILFCFHWWSTPEFEPPHNFVNDQDAYNCIKEHCPNSVVYSLYAQKQWKPSKAQINALYFVVSTGKAASNELGILKELFKQLQTL